MLYLIKIKIKYNLIILFKIKKNDNRHKSQTNYTRLIHTFMDNLSQ
jgi:hypothetical protein